MTQGFSGGFFLPAQRSVHCNGGFFASSSRGIRRQAGEASNQQQFPVLFTLPSSASRGLERDGGAQPPDGNKPKAPVRRVYHPEEADEDCGKISERPESEDVTDQQPGPVKRSVSTSRASRSHRPTPPSTRRDGSQKVNTQSVKASKPVDGDINTKFEIAMKELNQIKDEFDLKQQRQHSAPALMAASDSLSGRSSSDTPSLKCDTNSKANITSSLEQEAPDPEQPQQRNLQSPRQRLQVAEMVMRKLYKKNVQTEQELAAAKEKIAKLTRRMHSLEASDDPKLVESSSYTAPSSPTASVSHACPKCTSNETLGFVLANPPSIETVSHIDRQQLDYLRHLAAEQDRTITSLKIRIEELSTQLTSAKQKQTGKVKTATPRQVVTKLQSKLQDALQESERQKSQYTKLKRDFQHLLALKTKTLYDNPTQLNASARELVALMEKQIKQLEVEHSQNLNVYNSKLYEIEQQSCESYAQQKLMEEEMERVAKDVQQRDAIDVQIEQCMAHVFERLQHVERENVVLKKQFKPDDDRDQHR